MLKLIILIFFAAFSLPFAIRHKHESPEKSLKVNSLTANLSLESLNLILYWTPFFSDNPLNGRVRLTGSDIFDNGLTFGSLSNTIEWSEFARLKSCSREFPRCLITSTRGYIKQAKYVLFHWKDYNMHDLPAERSPNQTWILYNFEPPSHVWFWHANLSENVHPSIWFNLTATYRLDSGIHLPSGLMRLREDAIDPMANPLAEASLVNLKTKTRLVTWFVSNCNSANHREQYVQQLSKFIEVDIYGECGPLKCSRDNQNACYEMMQEKYYFYLSFENSNCIDYITEKVYNVMQYNVVPVVYGGANYSLFLPAGSYIDASHMKPRDLAHLLIDIGNNRPRYLKFFEWKKDFVLNAYPDPPCTFCDRLEKESANPDTMPKHRTISHAQINSWFLTVDACYNTTYYQG